MRMRNVAVAGCLCVLCCLGAGAQGKVTLRYAHMNSPGSVAGLQAAFFAEKVAEYSSLSIKIEVYPNSQLGSLQEQIDQVSSGKIAFHHNTAGAIGTLYEDYAVLDTPYAYRDVAHLLRVVNPASPLMAKLGSGLLKKGGVRVLYTFYFGARELSCDRPIKRPADLRLVKIRSIPFPIYNAAVEGLGAIPTPIDWALTPTALEAKVVNGQENPVDIVLDSKLYESQPYLLLTGHMLAADTVLANDAVLRGLSDSQRAAIARAAAEASAYATRLTLKGESADLEALKAKGMKVIGPAEGLDLAAFQANTAALVRERFGAKWAAYYRLIDAQR
jgi:TRAP-type transport system periplasmic protein